MFAALLDKPAVAPKISTDPSRGTNSVRPLRACDQAHDPLRIELRRSQGRDLGTIQTMALGHGIQARLPRQPVEQDAAAAGLDKRRAPRNPHRRTTGQQYLRQGQRTAIVVRQVDAASRPPGQGEQLLPVIAAVTQPGGRGQARSSRPTISRSTPDFS